MFRDGNKWVKFFRTHNRVFTLRRLLPAASNFPHQTRIPMSAQRHTIIHHLTPVEGRHEAPC